MSFQRTQNGLSNLYLFLNVDAVIFLEGGQSVSRDDVEQGSYTGSSPDIRFWQSLFSFYRPGKTFQFRSVGSKETVKSIAEDIDAGSVKNVIVAMDRDFDHVNSRIINSGNVIYTKGYSWENDSWNESTIADTFCSFSGSPRDNINNELRVIQLFLKRIWIRLKGAIRIDAVLSQNNSSLFDRKSYFRYILITKNGCPEVNVGQIKQSMLDARRRQGKPIIRRTAIPSVSITDCFGHLFAEYSYRILCYLLVNLKKMPKIPKDYATTMIVEKFIALVKDGTLPEIRTYYDNEFARVTY